MLRTLRSLSPALAVALLAAPAAAHAAPVVKKAGASTSKTASKAKTKTIQVVFPTITSISPRKIQVGQRLTVLGTGFKPGKGKSSVAFYQAGRPIIFVKADSATTTKLVVTVDPKVADLLIVRDNAPVATMLRLRVVGAKMSRTWTRNSRSPIVSPLPGAPINLPGTGGAVSTQQAAAQVYQTCQDTAKANPTGDNDGDSIDNATELANSMDPCNADTDKDGVSDGYEYDSARDLNGVAPHYPTTKPMPNPLDPTDTNSDFDGDGLYMWQEYKLWRAATGGAYPVTVYSDGLQNSGGKVPVVTLAQHYLDLNGDGNLTDDERDEDGDGLSNEVEFNMQGIQEWWKDVLWPIKPHGTGTYQEPVYTARTFNDLDATNPDSDGDGILDGADDQDNDGWSNFVEMQLTRWQSGYRVNPFNPCLPDPHSLTCSRHPPLDQSKRWPPFDLVDSTTTSQMTGDAMPFTWPAQMAYSDWTTAGRPAPGSFNTTAPALCSDPANPSPQISARWISSSAWQTYLNSHSGTTLPVDPTPNGSGLVARNSWGPTEFGCWNPTGWFTGAWDGQGGAQG